MRSLTYKEGTHQKICGCRPQRFVTEGAKSLAAKDRSIASVIKIPEQDSPCPSTELKRCFGSSELLKSFPTEATTRILHAHFSLSIHLGFECKQLGCALLKFRICNCTFPLASLALFDAAKSHNGKTHQEHTGERGDNGNLGALWQCLPALGGVLRGGEVVMTVER